MSTRPLLHSLWRVLNAPRRLVRGLSPSRALRLVLWGIVLAAFELLGRFSPSDWIDGIGVIALLCCAVAATEVHRRRWNRIKRRTKSWLERRGQSWKLVFGLDLRGDPPLPQRFPWRYGLLYSLTVGACVVAWFFRDLFPTEARTFLRGVSGLVYLALLALLWSVLFLGILGSWLGLGEILREILQNRRPQESVSHRLRLALIGLGVVALACAVMLPREVSVVALLTLVGVYSAFTLSLLPLRVTWKPAGEGGGAPRWSRLGLWEAGAVSWGGLLMVIPILLAGGDRTGVGEGGPDVSTLETGATALFGLGFAWSQTVAVAVVLGYLVWSLTRSHLADPGRRVPVRVVVDGLPDARTVRAADAVLRQAGLRAVAPDRAEACDVHVRVDETTLPEDTLWATRWPLPVRLQDLTDPELHARLERRSRIQRRRSLMRGLRKLLKHAAARTFDKGEGFWIAPHLWFITHLSRDTDETPMGSIGPPYHRVIPLAARRHLHEVLRAIEVDLIFLEDGVGFRRFKRVMGALFEFYDLFGERRLEEGLHFAGLPGVSVAIHDFQLEQPLVKTGYPEPDYEDLGRARILHVFRDRGGGEDRVDEPLDTRGLPKPVNLLPVLF